MDCKRFPTDWASTEIVKQYLCGQCKTKQRKHQVVATSDDDNIDGNRVKGRTREGMREKKRAINSMKGVEMGEAIPRKKMVLKTYQLVLPKSVMLRLSWISGLMLV